jgi:hypothetical protein
VLDELTVRKTMTKPHLKLQIIKQVISLLYNVFINNNIAIRLVQINNNFTRKIVSKQMWFNPLELTWIKERLLKCMAAIGSACIAAYEY